MSETVSPVAFPDDRRLEFNIEFDVGDTWHGSRLTVATDPIEDAIAISNQELHSRCVRMPSTQIEFLADGKLDVLGDEIDTVSQLNQLGRGRARKTRIDFNYDWATLRPPEFNVRRPPVKAESSQTAQRHIGDTLMLVISQRSWIGALTIDEMRWAAEVNSANPNDLISHYVNGIMGALCKFFDEYPRRGLPFALGRRRHAYVLSAQQIGRVFG
ncbi:hypothetical protein X770_30590 [Mesorhizobium sp. LSJC269B00]|nr:hypothetical protein X770_30590 [Mesorhizobium sp. LSJC269B00]